MDWSRCKILLGTVFLLGELLSPSRVVAHPRLLASQPAAESSVTGPAQRVELRFSERLEQEFHSVTITTQEGKPANVYRLEVDSANPTVLVVRCEPLLGGRYHVLWRVLSRDGHTGNGTFSFFVRKDSKK